MSNDSQSPYEGRPQSQFNSYGQDSGSGMPVYGGQDGAQYGQGGYGSQPYGQQPYGQPGYGVQGATMGQPAGGTPENLDLPLYGATLPQAFVRYFKRYANFYGRSSRSEFWWMELVLAFVYFGLLMLMGTVGSDRASHELNPFGVFLRFLFYGIMLGCAVSNWASGARRLHDAGMSGWLQLLSVIPVLGLITLWILWALPSKPLGRLYDDPNAPGVREQYAGQSGFGGL